MENHELSPEQCAQFAQQGFVVVEGFLDAALVEQLRERFARLFGGEYETGLVPDEVNWVAGRDPDDVTRQICNAWKADRIIARVVLSARVGQACARLAGWPGARLNQDNLFWKPPGGRAIGFHQDSAYEQWVVPSDMVSCWIALDDTSAGGGSVEYVPGSQRWPRVAATSTFHAPDDPTAALDVAAAAAGIAAPERVAITVAAGAAAFHDGWLWHGSDVNRSDRARRSLVAHCMRADARFHPTRVGPIYGRYRRFGELAMDESFFPVLWSEDGRRSAFIEPYLAGAWP